MARKTTGKTTTSSGAKRGQTTTKEMEKLHAGPARGEAAVAERPEERPPVSEVSTLTLAHDQIANRAREIWERRGRPHGQDNQIWHDAEDELRRQMER